ncbi:PPG1 [Candida oxycetoniae]|uniref:Serine/threonine-protein phosphatase n=1 Tax=Candida oxycetoniae TaxID=497107 RepID=A0AAI9SZE2_9ASCO|nr:PPG1 [Candida oxycetoniae]KAI3405504.2 PPG1 [Candida oxycetoniae]
MTVPFSIPTSDLDYCLEQLLEHKPPKILPPETIHQLCHILKTQLLAVPNIMSLQSPISVVGDIHGQYHDLLEIFRIGGSPPNTNYLFLGDYVDRGYYSVETISLLLVLKIRYPNRISLIRGNHESRTITTNYGFYTEVLNKYNGSSDVWANITDLFDYLPLGATIDGTIFACHGGLSPSCQQLDQIRAIDRFREIPHDGIMADLVWSDPDVEIVDFKLSPRGAGYLFGSDIMNKFCNDNNLVQMIRAHQLCNEGYTSYWKGKCLTVWSAPNYCYRCGNKASVLEILHSNYTGKAETSIRSEGEVEVDGMSESTTSLYDQHNFRFDKQKSQVDQGVLPGQFFNIFEASKENDEDTINGKSVNGMNSSDGGELKSGKNNDFFAAYFLERPRRQHVEYFL